MARKAGFKNPNAGRKKIPLIMEIPPKAIIFEQVVYWINLQATQEEVAGSFRVSVETLNARLEEHFGMNFSELRKRVDGEAKLSLRRFQFKQAEKNATMAIWLGKIWLGQKEDLMNELKDWMIHEMRAGIKQISEESRGQAASEPRMEIEQPLSDS
jgi:hypothetical protein